HPPDVVQGHLFHNVHQDGGGVRRDRCVLSLRHCVITATPPLRPETLEHRSRRPRIQTGKSMNATNVADLVAALHTFERGKVVGARGAVALSRSGHAVATSGFGGIGFAANIAISLESRSAPSARHSPNRSGPAPHL